MAFTYTGTLSTDLEKVRFNIGDTIEGRGVKPDRTASNFSDAEITGLLTIEGTWQRATAAAFEALAATWAAYPQTYNNDTSSRNWDAAREFRAQAKEWRDQYGYGDTGASSFSSVTMTRADGYSNNLDAITNSEL